MNPAAAAKGSKTPLPGSRAASPPWEQPAGLHASRLG
jgi:hypothetical protein